MVNWLTINENPWLENVEALLNNRERTYEIPEDDIRFKCVDWRSIQNIGMAFPWATAWIIAVLISYIENNHSEISIENVLKISKDFFWAEMFTHTDSHTSTEEDEVCSCLWCWHVKRLLFRPDVYNFSKKSANLLKELINQIPEENNPTLKNDHAEQWVILINKRWLWVVAANKDIKDQYFVYNAADSKNLIHRFAKVIGRELWIDINYDTLNATTETHVMNTVHDLAWNKPLYIVSEDHNVSDGGIIEKKGIDLHN